MELIGTAERGVVLKKLNRTQKTKGKPLPYSPLLSNLDSNAFKEGATTDLTPTKVNFLQYESIHFPIYSRDMTKNIHWARIVIAGFLVEAAIFAVFIPVFVLLGEQPGIYTAVLASFAMTFLFGMWVGRRIESRFVLHGMLVGVAATLVYIWSVLRT